jgi:hypothetical protein
MRGKGLATAAAFCVLATNGALAQTSASADSGRTQSDAPAQRAAKPAQWPLVMPDKSAAKARATVEWSQQDIEQAQARCTALLKGLDLVVVPEVPIREGQECGTPAPMKLISLGKSPQIALSPPPVMTCDMIATLYRWMQRDVQPLARKHLGAPVIRIDAMSSYSCRNAYGRAHSKLSEHGKANALDISTFVTARGQAAMVVANWGPTAREIEAQAAADKADGDSAAAKVTIVPLPDPRTRNVAAQKSPAEPADAGPRVLRPGMAISIPGVTVLMPGGSQPEMGMGLAPASRLGGPKPQVEAPTAAEAAKMDFLRAAHQSACRIFNTVLGPEANSAHRNHFHVDMAERIKNTRICE